MGVYGFGPGCCSGGEVFGRVGFFLLFLGGGGGGGGDLGWKANWNRTFFQAFSGRSLWDLLQSSHPLLPSEVASLLLQSGWLYLRKDLKIGSRW